MPTTKPDHRDLTDQQLISSVRMGDQEAFGELYRRHHDVAQRIALRLARCSSDADDFVAEAFTATLRLLARQLGPSEEFRPYLLTAVRHAAYGRTREEGRLKLVPDSSTMDIAVSAENTVIERFERSLMRKAFDTLPARWRTVLRLTEFTDLTLLQVAQQLGTSTEGATALAYRAREGLRRAFLRAHLDDSTPVQCVPFTNVLPEWTRDGLSQRLSSRVRAHVDRCGHCATQADRLRKVNVTLRPRRKPTRCGLSGDTAAA